MVIPLLLTPDSDTVCLRSLCGSDELAVDDTRTASLLPFLESLIAQDSSGNTLRAAQIITADRDRLLATLHRALYGPRIESTLSCTQCNEKFDLNFSLDDLLHHYRPTAAKSRTYAAAPGITFRLPTGEDELLTDGLPPAQAEKILLQRCLVEGNPETDNGTVQQKMAEVAPVINLKMEACCPECGHRQHVQFDIQSFFLTKLKQERATLLREVHCIASQYHWSQQEILALPRSIRKQYAAFIQSGT